MVRTGALDWAVGCSKQLAVGQKAGMNRVKPDCRS